MHRRVGIGIVVIAVGIVLNYFVVQAILDIPCEEPEICDQIRTGGFLIVAACNIFAIIVVAPEFAKDKR